jgi:hypothetical protein
MMVTYQRSDKPRTWSPKAHTSTRHKRAQKEPSDADIDASDTSDMYNLPMLSKYHAALQAAKTPEFTFRKEPSDIDKLVMAIGSLTTSILTRASKG